MTGKEHKTQNFVPFFNLRYRSSAGTKLCATKKRRADRKAKTKGVEARSFVAEIAPQDDQQEPKGWRDKPAATRVKEKNADSSLDARRIRSE